MHHGWWLEHIDVSRTDRVTVVDINPEYIEVTRSRFAQRIPQLELIQADLESCELDIGVYDLIHCALVLEYVDPDIVLAKAARWLSPHGVLVVVLQLDSPGVQAVTETGYESLKLVEPFMRLRAPEDIRQQAQKLQLEEVTSSVERLETGKQFYIGFFRTSETT